MENHDKDENSRNSQVNTKDSGNSDSGKARNPVWPVPKPGLLGQIPVNYPQTCGRLIELEKDAPRVPSTLNRPSLNRSVSSPAATHSDRRTNPASRTSRPDFRNVLEC